MKKFYSLLFVALAVVAMAQRFVSCEKENYVEPEPEPKPESKCQMTFTTAKSVGSSIFLIIKEGNRPTEVIGAEAVFGTNPFDGGPGNDEEVVVLVLEKQSVTIKGDITHLTFYDPELTALDVSQNPMLKYLKCSVGYSFLTSLDVSKNTALETLVCDNNNLTSLDVSKNTALQVLSCEENNLTSIDISKNTELYAFSCAFNKITSLDISKNTKLRSLDCRSNKIKAEEMSKIVNALPDWSAKKDEMRARIFVLATHPLSEENEITEEAIKIAEEKNWEIFNY